MRLPVPVLARGLLLLAAAACAAYGVSVLPGVRSGPSAVWEVWIYGAAYLAIAAVTGLRAARDGSERSAWALLTLGLLFNTAGSFGYAVAYSGEDEIPYYSLFDVLWLAYYPCVYASLGLLLRSRVDAFRPSMWLDGLVAGFAVAGLTAALAFDRLISTGGEPVAMLVNVAYPAADLLLVLLLVGAFAAMSWRPDPTWGLLGLGIVVGGVADTIYLLQAAEESYVEAGFVDFLWLPGVLLFGFAAWAPSRTVAPASMDDWRALFVPSVSTVLAACVLAFSAVGGGREIATALCLTALLGSVARTSLTFREVRALAGSREQARTDELTGLPNRRAFMERLCADVHATRPAAVLLLDLDGFKELNDTLGHHVGDELLLLVGKRLAGAVRREDHLARLGGDEFAVILSGHGDGDSALAAARRLIACLDEAFVLEGIPVRVEGSVGVTLLPGHATSAAEALQHADVAMYQAKRDRSEVALYDSGRNEHSRDRLATVGALRDGMGTGELVLHYQPQVELATGRLVGFEALMRWQHPSRGLLGPAAFLPAVEHTSFMRPLTDHLIASVLHQAACWRGTPLEAPIAVNLSAPNLLDRSLPGRVATLLEAAGLPSSCLRLEVTENAVLVDADRAAHILANLRALGVLLSVDDFGTGHSSLGRLRDLPVDELKIDRSFVLGMAERDADAAIVEAAITLARRLGLRLIAEGIESQAVCDRLETLGCPIGQGYHLGRPKPPKALEHDLLGAERPTQPSVAEPV